MGYSCISFSQQNYFALKENKHFQGIEDFPLRWAMCVGEESEAEYSEVGQEELQQLASKIKTKISQYGEFYVNWS